jgi:hypothetical protein
VCVFFKLKHEKTLKVMYVLVQMVFFRDATVQKKKERLCFQIAFSYLFIYKLYTLIIIKISCARVNTNTNIKKKHNCYILFSFYIAFVCVFVFLYYNYIIVLFMSVCSVGHSWAHKSKTLAYLCLAEEIIQFILDYCVFVK